MTDPSSNDSPSDLTGDDSAQDGRLGRLGKRGRELVEKLRAAAGSIADRAEGAVRDLITGQQPRPVPVPIRNRRG